MVRLLHSADWQIGMTRHFLTDEAQSRYSEARLESIRRIAVLAADERCDFVVVAGDVFESNLVDRQVVARALDALAEFTVPVFLLPGNHDPLVAAGSVWDSPVFTARCPRNVTVIRDATPLVVPGIDAEVIGAVWRSKRPVSDLVGELLGSIGPRRTTRILVGHGAVDRGSPDRDAPSLIGLDGLEQAIADGRIHYAALGDRHSTTAVGATERVWYSGTPLATDYTEDAPNQVLLVELDEDGASVASRTVGDWTFRSQAFELRDDHDVAAVSEWLMGLPDKRRCVAKVSFVGTVSLATKIRLDGVIDEHADLLAALEVWDRRTDLVVIPDDADLADLGLGGFVAATIDDLRSLAATAGDGAELAQDALSLLFRFAQERR